MGGVAHEGSMRGGSAIVAAILLNDELALGKCPFQEGIHTPYKTEEAVVDTTTTTALVGHATSAATTTVGVATATV
jgi:hypothetical protein